MTRLRQLAPTRAERIAARQAWVKATADAWREATLRKDERCCEAVGRMSEPEFERFCDEEQAKLDAIRAPLNAVKEWDQWPRELHWGGL